MIYVNVSDTFSLRASSTGEGFPQLKKHVVARLDRLTHHVDIVEVNSESYRPKPGRSRQATKAR